MVLTLALNDRTATRGLGLALGRSLPPCVILLEGELGSGKTTLVQSLGEGLGITDAIVSPTFTLINEYPEGRIPLYHLDLYRLQPEEVEGLHPELYWQSEEYPAGIVAIEWPDRLVHRPGDYLHICLQATGEASRRAELSSVGNFVLPQLHLP